MPRYGAAPTQASRPRGPTSGEETDVRLVERCRAGDRQAWERLLERYERLVFAIPLRMGLSREDAADVAQTTFTSLLTQLERVRDPERLGAWLSSVARRQAWRILERQRRADAGAAAVVAQRAVAVADEELERWERTEVLLSALRSLPPRCRELLTLLYLDEAEPTYAEAADRLGRPLGSIGPSRARCLEQLRRLLEDG